MLSNNDVQLFYKLLDSLSSSLKELAIKYELIVRASDSNAEAMSDMAKDMSCVSRDIEKVGVSVREAKDQSASDTKSMNESIARCIKEINDIREVLGKVTETRLAETERAIEVDRMLKHVDSHLDSNCVEMARVGSKILEVAESTKGLGEMEKSVREMREVVVPVALVVKKIEAPIEAFKKHLKKPATVLLVIYIVLASYVAFAKATVWIFDSAVTLGHQLGLGDKQAIEANSPVEKKMVEQKDNAAINDKK